MMMMRNTYTEKKLVSRLALKQNNKNEKLNSGKNKAENNPGNFSQISIDRLIIDYRHRRCRCRRCPHNSSDNIIINRSLNQILKSGFGKQQQQQQRQRYDFIYGLINPFFSPSSRYDYYFSIELNMNDDDEKKT